VQQAIDEIAKAHAFWRDVQEVATLTENSGTASGSPSKSAITTRSCVVARGFEDTSAGQRRIGQ
jgi:hypothetical protein